MCACANENQREPRMAALPVRLGDDQNMLRGFSHLVFVLNLQERFKLAFGPEYFGTGKLKQEEEQYCP